MWGGVLRVIQNVGVGGEWGGSVLLSASMVKWIVASRAIQNCASGTRLSLRDTPTDAARLGHPSVMYWNRPTGVARRRA